MPGHGPRGGESERVSGSMHSVAGAALPIAVLLLLAGVIARGILAAEAGDEQLRRSARRLLEPLCIAALVAAGIDLIAVIVAGSPSAAALAVPLAIIAIAIPLGSAGAKGS